MKQTYEALMSFNRGCQIGTRRTRASTSAEAESNFERTRPHLSEVLDVYLVPTKADVERANPDYTVYPKDDPRCVRVGKGLYYYWALRLVFVCDVCGLRLRKHTGVDTGLRYRLPRCPAHGSMALAYVEIDPNRDRETEFRRLRKLERQYLRERENHIRCLQEKSDI